MVAVDITYKADYRAYPYDDIVIDLERGENSGTSWRHRLTRIIIAEMVSLVRVMEDG